MADAASLEVKHNRDRNRFEIDLGTDIAVLDYSRADGSVVFTHTQVPPPFEGRGIAAKLVEAGLQWTKSEGCNAVPQCPYLVTFIRRHPEWAAVVHPAWADRVKRGPTD